MGMFSKLPTCQVCSSPFCDGRCQQQAGMQQLVDQQNLHLQKLRYEMMQRLLGVPQHLTESPVKRKPLPEESILCATGGIIGWRLWRIPCFGDTLLSINGEEWKPKQPLRAVCKKGATSCLGTRCDCGIYAWKKAENVEVNDGGYSCVKGEVWLWGKIIEHEKGYRAEYAYPKSFMGSSADEQRMTRLYL